MKKLSVALSLLLAAFALAACGSSSSDSSSSETQSQSGGAAGGKSNPVEAEGKSAGSATSLDFETASSGLAYSTDTASAKAGKVTVDFTNTQPLSHDVAIEDSSGKTIAQTEITAEGSDSTVADLKPGTYHYYCTVPGHREAGMEGTLTVK
jgi:plastocyanin